MSCWIGYDLCRATAMRAGFYRAAFGSMSPKAPTFGEYSFQSSPHGAYFWCAQVIAMDGMYAGFAGAKTGHGRLSFCWCFVLPNSFSSAFAPPGRSHQNPVLAVWMMRHPDEYTVKSCEIDLRFRHQRGQFCNEIQRFKYYMGSAISIWCL